jgi:IclR family acetate operon transcriptional repressor
MAELASALDLDRNQVFRSLRTLEQAGFLNHAADGRYSVSSAVFTLAAGASSEPSIVQAASSELDWLALSTGETVHLFARQGDLAVCIDRRESAQSVRLVAILGRAVPLHAGAVPKAMLAFLPSEQRDRILDQLPELPRYSEYTQVDPISLLAELAQIRRQGFAVSDRDFDPAARGVGAPVFGADGEVIGGISVGGPATRLQLEFLGALGAQVAQVAHSVSLRLGFLPSAAAPEYSEGLE